MLPSIILGNSVTTECESKWSNEQIDNAWIRVPWTTGGYYYHNTKTREDRDTPPQGVEL